MGATVKPSENPGQGNMDSAGSGCKETGPSPFVRPVRPIETPAPEVPLQGAPAPSRFPARRSGHPSPRCNAPFSGFANCVLDAGHEGGHAHTRFSVEAEPPYPEAPLASRKADLSEREVPEASFRAGRGRTEGTQPLSRSERSDFKAPPRYIDPEVLRQFHDTQPDCLTCGYYRVSAHHLVPRAQGGDDVAENLIPLCGMCHGCLHSGGKWQAYGASMTTDAVRDGIGRFLTSEAGESHLAYVKTKLGVGAAAFLSKYGVEEDA